jgi:hypothetical protein
MATDDGAAAMPMMAIGGTAKRTVSGKEVALSSFARFLASADKYSAKTLDELDGATLCDQVIWREFTHFLAKVEEHKSGCTIEYLRKSFYVTRGKFGGNLEHASFFEDLLDDKNWFKGMVRNVEKDAFEEACARNETVAQQAEPVYMYHRRKIAEALRRYDKPDGYKRLAVVQMNGIASGRPGEVAAMTPDVLKYDHNSHVPYAIWPQQKTHKHKASEACARSFSLCVDRAAPSAPSALRRPRRPRRAVRAVAAASEASTASATSGTSALLAPSAPSGTSAVLATFAPSAPSAPTAPCAACAASGRSSCARYAIP